MGMQGECRAQLSVGNRRANTALGWDTEGAATGAGETGMAHALGSTGTGPHCPGVLVLIAPICPHTYPWHMDAPTDSHTHALCTHTPMTHTVSPGDRAPSHAPSAISAPTPHIHPQPGSLCPMPGEDCTCQGVAQDLVALWDAVQGT